MKIEHMGKLLAVSRREQGLSRYKLRAMTNVADATIFKIERGGDTKLSTLAALAAALGWEIMLKKVSN